MPPVGHRLQANPGVRLHPRTPDWPDPGRVRTPCRGVPLSRRLFTSESATEGHPDKIADAISDSILDALLKADARSRVAIETLITTGQIHVAGEATTDAYVDVEGIARDRVLQIGYDSSKKGFDGASCGVSLSIHA